MVKLEKKQVKIVSVLIALAFIGSVVALALTQSGSGLASAASSSVGVIDYRTVAAQHPKLQQAEQTMQNEVQNAQKEFEEKRRKYEHAMPFTKESLLYREIFEKYYPGQSHMIADFWMPNKEWEGCNVNDPSARVLSNYGNSGK